MTNLRIAFIVIAGLNVLINLIRLVFDSEEKSVKFNAVAGWTCAILYAIPE